MNIDDIKLTPEELCVAYDDAKTNQKLTHRTVANQATLKALKKVLEYFLDNSVTLYSNSQTRDVKGLVLPLEKLADLESLIKNMEEVKKQ